MMSQSGFQLTPRKSITQAPLNSFQMAYAPTMPLENTVPIAAPRVPKAGTGPKPRMNSTLNPMLPMVTASPSLSGVRESPAERSAPPSMKNSIMPKPNTNMMRTAYTGLVSCSGEARDEHAHAAEQRRQKDHDHEEDLQPNADTGIAGEADKMTDHGVVDHSLQPANHILQY